jgi:hypothetical protein
MLGYQVTYKQTDHDCNKGTTHSDTLHFPSVAIMALRRNILQEDDILCELYADTRSDVSDSSDNENLDSDSDVSATSSRKQLRSSVVVVNSDSETSTREEEISETEDCDDKTSDMWCKTD